ncbi:PREDICTED: uncharacterized protein LOC108768539, partial [Trachymyrmex cornetzi]|uniref:uncharacterized protein LOC108768539 n=1 Tax=Trachymyrmex cornetzi TaxID=471704 RepID=UPI00084EE68B
MDLVLTGLQGEELFVYMDDIVIYAASLDEHERKYNLLIERLRKADLKLQPDKCEFLKTEVTYLGHVISKDGVKPDPKKLEAAEEGLDSPSTMQKDVNEPTKSPIQDLSNRIQTRSQTRNKNIHQGKLLQQSQENEDEIEEIENGNDPPDKKNDYEDDASSKDENQESKDSETNGNKNSGVKPTIANSETVKSNVIDSRDLLFLCKDNVAYFVNTKGKPLDSGSQKLFERNEIPSLNPLTLGEAKAVKYKKYYHIALPISDGQREGPTMTLTQISAAIKDLRVAAENRNLETLSIAKMDYVNNVPWSNIKTVLQLTFADSPIKLIICNGLVKYPPKDLRSAIIGEIHCLPVRVDTEQCLQCQLKKLVRVKTKQPMMITDTPGSSFDKVAMDIVGPLSKTEKGNEYILTLQDQLTKFCMGIPLPNQTAETVAEAFVD